MGRRDECPRCQSDARVCLNCVFYDSGSYRECREEQADWVKEKSTGNFCSYFTASASPRGSGSADEVARSKLDQLFGGAKPQSEESKPGASMAEQLAKFRAKGLEPPRNWKATYREPSPPKSAW